MLLGGFDKQIKYFGWAPEVFVGGIGSEGEQEEDNQDDDCMRIVGEESCFDTTKHGIEYDTHREQEASSSGWDSGERCYDGRPSREQHRCDQDICEQAKDHEDDMRDCSIARPDNFEEGMGVWCSSLQFDCDGCKKNDLDGCTGGVPERSTDAIIVCDSTRLE